MSPAQIIRLPVLLLTLAACGDDRLIGPERPPGDTLPPAAGDNLTSQQRMAVLDAVQMLVLALPGQDFTGDTRVLVETIRALPEFEGAGSSADGTVWGTFRDGTLVFIVNGGPPADPPSAAALPTGPTQRAAESGSNQPELRPVRAPPLAAHRPRTLRLASSATASVPPFGTVPSSSQYRLLNAIDSYFDGTDPRAEIAAMLDEHGYRGTTGTATLAALRAVSGDGIFYYRAHGGGGSVNRRGTPETYYALWTADPALNASREASDAGLLEDLRQNRVVYMLFRASRWGIQSSNRHYGITHKFVSHYMSFARNSLVYIDACDGAYSPLFRQSFRGISVFAGWNERAAFSAMDRTARYVFDRLLGANRFAPEDPPQRPFGYEALQTSDPKFGTGKPYGYSTWIARDGGTISADFGFYHLRDSLAIFAPSIAFVRADEVADELRVFGEFGPDPRTLGLAGTVSIEDGGGGVSLAITKWQSDQIIAHLPSAGAGSSGDVVVRIRDHRSNPRRLVAWRGKMHYTWREQGTLTYTVDMDLHGRVDPGLYRGKPGETPKPHPVPEFRIPETAQASWTATGTHSFTDPAGCTQTTTWSGASSMTAAETQRGTFGGGGKIDMVAKRMTLNFGFMAGNAYTNTHTVQCPGGGSITVPQPGVVLIWPEVYDDYSRSLIYFDVDDLAHLQAHSRTRSASGAATAILRWPIIAAQPPFDPRQPQ